MILRANDADKKEVGPMKISHYRITPSISASLIEINGNHGKIKCLNEDRIYFIIYGEGKFIINNKETSVSKDDLVFIPQNTPYNIIGKMKYFLICSPEFNPKDDIILE